MIDVEPLIVSELDVLLPLPDGGRADWQDVVRRSGLDRRRILWRGRGRWPLGRRRSLALVLLAVAAIVFLVAPALGIAPPVLDFFSSKHASKRVVHQFDLLNAGAPRGMSPRVIAGETHLVTTYHRHNGVAFPLWVAPTRKGGFCFVFGYGGGCADRKPPTHSEPGDHNGGAIGLGRYGSTVLAGYVYDKQIANLEVRFKHAPTVSVPLLWVSPPIDAGFFFYDITRAQQRQGGPVAVVALDEHGKELARVAWIFRPKPAWFDPRKVADLSKRHVILRSGQASIAIAPSRTGGNCFWLRYGYATMGTGCAPPRYQTVAMAGGLNHGTNFTVFSAQVKPAVERVELRFEDSTKIVLRPVEGFVLYTLPQGNWPRGHRLTEAVAYSALGAQLAKQTFDPKQVGTYPCSKQVPIGAGQTACP
jgi:hypothetical protein